MNALEYCRRQLVRAAVAGVGLSGLRHSRALAQNSSGVVLGSDTALLRDGGGASLARYVFGAMPTGEKAPAVPFTDFTHPVWTPAGEIVTDVGAVDHPHHRGVFCAWIQAGSTTDGDWWGWGARAPKDGRTIASASVKIGRGRSPGVEAVNLWKAPGENVLRERLRVSARRKANHTIVDFEYHFSPATSRPVVIGRQPFGGFCYRARPRGEIIISDASGPLTTPDADPDNPARNWPARPWYDFSTKAPDGSVVGAAVIEHPSNPPSSWHIVRFAHMLNPCICRDQPIRIGSKGLTLRYRVAAHDGPADVAALNALRDDFLQS